MGSFSGKEKWGNELDGFYFKPEHVAKLLRRQHRATIMRIRNMASLSQALADNYMLTMQVREFHHMRVRMVEDILLQLKDYAR